MKHRKQYIWQFSSWPQFLWNNAALLKPLGDCRFRQGALLARIAEMEFENRRQSRAEVMIAETLKTSEIEGEYLDPDAVRSSVARRLGLPATGSSPVKFLQLIRTLVPSICLGTNSPDGS